MAIKLAQWERERFNYGESAGDGKGDYLHTHGVKAEHAETLVFSWLSGGASEVRLPNALPITRGGTGSTTASKARLNLGIFVNTNNELMFGSKAVSVYDGTVLDHDGTVKPTFQKLGVGKYLISGVTGFGPGFTYVLPKDEMGNLLCGCEITFTGEANVSVYAIKYEDGKAVLDKTVPMDLPNGRCIDISAK